MTCSALSSLPPATQPPVLAPGDRGGELLVEFHGRTITCVAAYSCRLKAQAPPKGPIGAVELVTPWGPVMPWDPTRLVGGGDEGAGNRFVSFV
jgi:hypothetical protein